MPEVAASFSMTGYPIRYENGENLARHCIARIPMRCFQKRVVRRSNDGYLTDADA